MKTDKYRQSYAGASTVKLDLIIDSIMDLPVYWVFNACLSKVSYLGQVNWCMLKRSFTVNEGVYHERRYF